MRNKLILVLVLLIFIILMLTAWILYDRLGADAPQQLLETETAAEEPTAPVTEEAETQQPQPDTPVYPAPDFTVMDAGGNEVHLSDFLGTPVVLNFWASWCGSCKNHMPNFETVFQEYGDSIAFMMVNLTDNYQETMESASAFLAETEYTFPVYFDTALDAAANYGVSSIPVTYFIDVNGNIAAMGQGGLTADHIMQGIGMILP